MSTEVFNMDCMEYMRTLPDKAFALALADPPYGMDASSSQGAGKLKKRVLNQGNIKRWDKAPTAEFFSELRRVCENAIVVEPVDERQEKTEEITCIIMPMIVGE